MTRGQKQIWGLVGAGVVVLTAAGVYFYVRSLRKLPRNARVEKVEAIIREAEELMRHHRSAARRG